MNRKNYVFAAVVFVLLLVLVWILSDSQKTTSFEIQDKCGSAFQAVLHTVESDGVCKIRCKSQCEVDDLKYDNHVFTMQVVGCHNCTCYCQG